MADDRMKVSQQQAALVCSDLIDSLIVDIATEAHRAARLGFDYKLNVEEEEEVRLAAHARAVVGDSGAIGTEIGNKHTVDVFGQTHPTIANEMFDCMNCGRPIVAGRFAPHLEKCMGKGRKARIKASRNVSTSQQRRARSNTISSYGATGSGPPNASRTLNRTPIRTLEDSQREAADINDGESEESREDDEKDLSYGLPCPGKARSKKCSGGIWKTKLSLMQMGVSGLVPVPLQGSPMRASCAASVASLSESTPAGTVAGMTVEVAVEQFNSFVSGRVPTSGDMGPKKYTKQAHGQGHGKSRRGGDKKKNLGQVLAGSSVMNHYSGPRQSEERTVSRENDCVTRTNGAERMSDLQNGSVGKVVPDSIRGPYANGDVFHVRHLSAGTSSAASVGTIGRKLGKGLAGRVGKDRGNGNSRLGVGVAVGARIGPKVDEDGDQVGKQEMVDFGKKKKRPRATNKPKQSRASMVPTASGEDHWVTVIEVFDTEYQQLGYKKFVLEGGCHVRTDDKVSGSRTRNGDVGFA